MQFKLCRAFWLRKQEKYKQIQKYCNIAFLVAFEFCGTFFASLTDGGKIQTIRNKQKIVI